MGRKKVLKNEGYTLDNLGSKGKTAWRRSQLDLGRKGVKPKTLEKEPRKRNWGEGIRAQGRSSQQELGAASVTGANGPTKALDAERVVRDANRGERKEVGKLRNIKNPRVSKQ